MDWKTAPLADLMKHVAETLPMVSLDDITAAIAVSGLTVTDDRVSIERNSVEFQLDKRPSTKNTTKVKALFEGVKFSPSSPLDPSSCSFIFDH